MAYMEREGSPKREQTMKTNEEQSNLVNHAKNEFIALGWLDENGVYVDAMQEAICKGLIDLLTLFSKQGHSGSSAPYAIGLFEKLASFKPIAPLTGTESEWMEISDGVYQNTRYSSVFKDAIRFNGQPYDIDGLVFYDVLEDDDGLPYRSYFTNADSAVPITFPYTPKTEYKERPA